MDEQYAVLLERLDECQLKPWDVLVHAPEELAKRVRISKHEIVAFKQYYAARGVEEPLTSIEDSALSTQMPELDALLGSGLRRGSLTEVCGPAASGKTCFCCQMALSAPSAVYIASEDNIAVIKRRMDQLRPRYGVLTNVRFVQIRSIQQLRVTLYKIAELSPPPSLVVLDSVAALDDSGTGNIDFFDLDDALGLRKLAARTKCAVLVANQVRSKVVPDHKARGEGPSYEFDKQQELVDGDERLRPALGHEWAAKLDTRLFLKPGGGPYRHAVLVFSKWAPYATLPLEMTALGLRVGSVSSLGPHATAPSQPPDPAPVSSSQPSSA